MININHCGQFPLSLCEKIVALIYVAITMEDIRNVNHKGFAKKFA